MAESAFDHMSQNVVPLRPQTRQTEDDYADKVKTQLDGERPNKNIDNNNNTLNIGNDLVRMLSICEKHSSNVDFEQIRHYIADIIDKNYNNMKNTNNSNIGVLAGQDLSTLPIPTSEDISGIESETEAEIIDILEGDENLLSLSETAKRFKLEQSAISKMIDNNKIIGIKVSDRIFIPAPQFKNKKPIAGIQEIIAMFGNDHEGAWNFLSTEIYYGDRYSTPIERLRHLKNDKGLSKLLKQFEASRRAIEWGDFL